MIFATKNQFCEYHSPNPDFTLTLCRTLGNYLTRLNLDVLTMKRLSQENGKKKKCFKVTYKVLSHCLTYSTCLIILVRH